MANLTLKDILIKSSDFLKNKNIDTPRLDTELIISHFLNINRMDIYLQFERILTQSEQNLIRNAIVERGKRKPLQYIIGIVYFLDSKITVNETVLIPRPETEFMIDYILKNESKPTSVLDLCTGSGVIAISIKKKWNDTEVYASDISIDAINIAKQNAENNDTNISFINSNLFNKINRKYDLIISNPPYISETDYNNLSPELFFEPKSALVADDNGYFFYKQILQNAKKFLNPNGKLYLEIGANQAEMIQQTALNNNFNSIKIIKDLANLNRIAIIK
ncbi:MAG: peptide chain release factor N(5)-glutamine methyltransferase [Candidatus Cloacimonetes bacterium]|nr:peptide chain release factor N(5)-glutamine methyltransferase [Candidatus Cloacimonadota bacterium]